MITKKKQIDNIIKWLDALPKYKKTTAKLGDQDGGKWSYCCLGVACRVTGLKNVDFEAGMDERLVDKLCLTETEGRFPTPFMINGKYVRTLTTMNDDSFEHDEDFTNQRKGMLLTLDNWIADPDVAKAVKKHFAKEIKQLYAKTPFEFREV